MAGNTLTLRLADETPEDNGKSPVEDQRLRPSSSLASPPQNAEQGGMVSAGAGLPAAERQSDFDYGAVPENIVGKLRDAANRIRNRSRAYLVETGRELRQWRDQLEPGQFHRWIEEECKLEVRTAQLAMMCARYADDVLSERERENFSRLPIAVQYQLAAPSVPEEVRQQVLEASAEGRPLKVSEVKQLVRAATRKMDAPDGPRDPNVGELATNDDEPRIEVSETASAEEQPAASSAPHVERTGSQPALVQPGPPEIHRPVRVISQSKLGATTTDIRKQALIKEMFDFAAEMTPTHRVTLISILSKLGDITAKQLAECLQ